MLLRTCLWKKTYHMEHIDLNKRKMILFFQVRYALDMGDDEPDDENGEQSAQAQEGEPDKAEDIQAVAEEPLKPVASFLMSERIAEHDKKRMLADGSRGRVSVKEKLVEMKQKISDQKMPEKPEVTKSKGKEESL